MTILWRLPWREHERVSIPTTFSRGYRNAFGRCAKTRFCLLLPGDRCFGSSDIQNTSPRLCKSTDFEENEAKFQVRREHVPNSRIYHPVDVKNVRWSILENEQRWTVCFTLTGARTRWTSLSVCLTFLTEHSTKVETTTSILLSSTSFMSSALVRINFSIFMLLLLCLL